ncbi:MAG: hypothetical protein ACHQNE_01945 [Candidatus Kapaibacterium sp.]
MVAIAAIFFAVGYLIGRMKRTGKDLKADAIPETAWNATLDPTLLNAYIEEWKQTIATQMHFNDLIIRFRTIVLTAFSTIIGALAVIATTFSSVPSAGHTAPSFSGVYWILFSLWGVAYMVDACYYHRLLIGSVAHAMKFDKNAKLRSAGLFGLTSRIGEEVRPGWSYFLIFIFYAAPAAAAVLVIVFS